jgi:ribose transport system substrate-binding protein
VAKTRMRRRLLQTVFTAALALGAAAPAMAADVGLVGITVGSLGNPYYAVTDRGIADKAHALTPGAKVTAVSADYDLSKQFTEIQNFIAAGAKIIMVNAVDPVAIAPAIKMARAAGIAVAAFDVSAEGADVTVMTDNVKAGWEACNYIVQRLPQGGDVVILNGPQISAIVDRVNGCKTALATNPHIRIVSSNEDGLASRDGGFAKGQGLLTRFPKLDAIFAINDPTAIGLNLAAKQLGRHEFIITSVDGSPDVETELRDKNSLIKASAAQDPYNMAGQAYALAVGVLDGKQPPAKIILITPKLITTDNIGSYGGWANAR